jgi:hypothetical protein
MAVPAVRVRTPPLDTHGFFYGLKFFACKTVQFSLGLSMPRARAREGPLISAVLNRKTAGSPKKLDRPASVNLMNLHVGGQYRTALKSADLL